MVRKSTKICKATLRRESARSSLGAVEVPQGSSLSFRRLSPAATCPAPRDALFREFLDGHPLSATLLPPINNPRQDPSPRTMDLEEPPLPQIVDDKPNLPPIRPSDLRLLTWSTTLTPPQVREFVLWPQKAAVSER